MKRIDEIIEGLKILSPYDNTGTSVGAEHDILYSIAEEDIEWGEPGEGGKSGSVVSKEDAAKLLALGWHISSDGGCWAFFT